MTSFLEIGLQRENMDESVREWWASLAGWIGIYGVGWLIVFGLALGGPPAFSLLGEWSHTAQGTAVLAWIATTVAGVASGKSSKTSGKNGNLLDYVAYAGAAVFLIGLVILLATILNLSIGPLLSTSSNPEQLWHSIAIHLIVASICLVTAIVMAQRVGVNTFSLQHMYANRLVRCYLGASRQKDRDEIDRPTGPPCNSPGPVRKPDPITGFDPNDDLPLSTFTPAQGYYGPLLIINTALNLTRGAELAWQDAKPNHLC